MAQLALLLTASIFSRSVRLILLRCRVFLEFLISTILVKSPLRRTSIAEGLIIFVGILAALGTVLSDFLILDSIFIDPYEQVFFLLSSCSE